MTGASALVNVVTHAKLDVLQSAIGRYLHALCMDAMARLLVLELAYARNTTLPLGVMVMRCPAYPVSGSYTVVDMYA